MVFGILIAVVFVAELIIAFALVFHLIKLNRMFNEYNSLITELNPKIKDIMCLCTKISEQILEYAPILVDNVKNTLKNIIAGQIKNCLSAVMFWAIKRETERYLNR